MENLILNSIIYCRYNETRTEYRTIYNTKFQCELAGVKEDKILKAYVYLHENQNRDCEDTLQYWGWLEQGRVSMIYSALFLTQMCCPDGFVAKESKKEGTLIRLNIITESELLEKVSKIINEEYNEESITEDLDQEMIEWIEQDALDEYNDIIYDAYHAYSHGEAEGEIVQSIKNDIMSKLGIGEDFFIDVAICDAIVEKYDILDR